MADENLLQIIRQGVDAWNDWRGKNLERLNLSGADLTGANLRMAILSEVNLWGANLRTSAGLN